MRRQGQELVAFFVAALLHVVALLVLRATLSGVVATPSLPALSGPELSFDVELSELAATPPTGKVTGDAANAGKERLARVESRRSGAEPTTGHEAATSDEASDATPAVEGVLDEAPIDSAPSPGVIDLGIGPDGWQRWVAPSKPGETVRAERTTPRANRFHVFRPRTKSSTGGLQEGLDEKDRTLGLGPQGRVLSASHKAAHATVAPQLGVARFDVTVLRTGAVEVTLGSASRDVEQWRQVAAQIAGDLRASPPRIAPPREGLKLVIEVVAEETMPNGTKITSLHGPKFEVTPPALKSTKKTQEQILEDNPTTPEADAEGLPPIQLDLPGVWLAERGKVCSYRLGLSMFGPVFQGGCDPSHLGAKPQRMVRARVVEQQLF